MRVLVLVVAATAALALASAGCGAQEEPEPAGAQAPAAEEAAPPATAVEITVWPEGERKGGAESWTLECDPAGGTHPAPEAACSLLAGNADALEPVPADTMCTQQYGGPEQAAIRGTIQGREVDLRFSRANGCEIARWDRLAPLFEPAEGS